MAARGLMHFLYILAGLGILQTLFALSHMNRRTGRIMSVALLVALCYIMYPYVLELNYIRVSHFLQTDSALFLMSSVLFIESNLKSLSFLPGNPSPPWSTHWINHGIRLLSRWLQLLVRNMPSVMMIFFVFYTQSYLFHHMEAISFQRLALVMTTSLLALLLAGSVVLRLIFGRGQLREIQSYLLLIQFIVAVTLPLMNESLTSPPDLYDAGIYVQTILIVGGMLVFVVTSILILKIPKLTPA